MRSPLIAALAVGSLLLVACGSDDSSSSTSDATTATAAPAAPTAPAAPAATAAPAAGGDESDGGADAGSDASAIVAVAATDLGDGLVGADGLTLYGFTNDTDGVPTCADACAGAWPPLMVDSAELPAGLDSAVFSVVERPDGGFQLKAGAWPLYFFAGDAAAGDVNGQGSGGVWFVAAPDGSLIGAGN